MKMTRILMYKGSLKYCAVNTVMDTEVNKAELDGSSDGKFSYQ